MTGLRRRSGISSRPEPRRPRDVTSGPVLPRSGRPRWRSRRSTSPWDRKPGTRRRAASRGAAARRHAPGREGKGVGQFLRGHPIRERPSSITRPFVTLKAARSVRSTTSAAIDVPGGYRLQVGDRVCLRPSHTDPTINLHDVFCADDGERVVDVWPIASRGYPEHRRGAPVSRRQPGHARPGTAPTGTAGSRDRCKRWPSSRHMAPTSDRWRRAHPQRRSLSP